MDTSGRDFRLRRAASPSLSPASRFQHEFLGKNLPRSSPLPPPSHPAYANDLDEIDEQDVWGFDSCSEDVSASARLAVEQASLPPRIGSASRNDGNPSVTPERRSFLKNGTLPWALTAVKGLSSVSGLPPEDKGVRDATGRIVGSESTSRRISTVSRMIPRLATEEKRSVKENLQEGSRQRMPQSAPVNIPDWSKLEQKDGKKGKWLLDNDDFEDEEDEVKLPPHELLAREYAKSQITSFSMREGAGRTLKGRDISRVRDAVLTRTGFLD